MPSVPFSEMPDHARLWVFAAERPLPPDAATRLLETVDQFLAGWHAHQVPLTAARDWRDDQFLLVAVDEQAAGVSGCSVDALVRTMKTLGQTLGIVLLDHAAVHSREAGAVVRRTRADFADAAAAGAVSPDTTVFDHTVASVGALRRGEWERPAATSWHGRAFFA